MRNKLLSQSINEKGEGFKFYLIPKQNRKYGDHYLLKIQGTIKKNKIELSMREWEALVMAVVIMAGIVRKKVLFNKSNKPKNL
jgi:hypothetical protein